MASGWPSRIVACEATVPGIPRSTDEIVSAVDVTANMPSSSANAETVSMPKVNGSRITRPITPPRPGTAPIHMPMKTPSIR